MEEQFGSDTPVYDSYFFMNDGQFIKSASDPSRACAKVNTLSTNTEGPLHGGFHYIKFFRGRLFDPNGVDANKAGQATYRKVDQETFSYYLDYLRTNDMALFLRAERRCIDV